MSLRLVEIILPEAPSESLDLILEEHPVEQIWREEILDDRYRVRVLLPVEETESLLDKLNKKFSDIEDFRVILTSVDATIPRPDQKEEDENESETTDQENQENDQSVNRISRDELYSEITDSLQLSPSFLVLVALSAIVAAFGLMKNDVAVIIGAMVIAPIIGPNIALGLATTLGDLQLAARSLRINLAGFTTGLVLSILIGFLMQVNPEAPEILARTEIGLIDIVLALSAGGAGALSFTLGLSKILIGVMVAVALLPPMVGGGLLIGSGHWTLGSKGLLLTLNNVICINLSAILTFLIQGIQPLDWWKAKNARKMTFIAVSIWTGMLIILGFIIALMKGWL